jgi:MFS family permease
MSLGAGFAKSAIVLFIIRAFQGLGAACSIPPAIRLIVLLTPDAEAQGLALQL